MPLFEVVAHARNVTLTISTVVARTAPAETVTLHELLKMLLPEGRCEVGSISVTWINGSDDADFVTPIPEESLAKVARKLVRL